MADTATDPVNFDLATVFRTIAATIPDHEVLVWRDKRFTYAQLAARVDGVTNFLVSARAPSAPIWPATNPGRTTSGCTCATATSIWSR